MAPLAALAIRIIRFGRAFQGNRDLKSQSAFKMELDNFMKRLYDVVVTVAGDYPYGPRSCPDQNIYAGLSSCAEIFSCKMNDLSFHMHGWFLCSL